MGAAKKLLDKKVLKELVPLNALSATHLDEISRKAIIETVRSGRYVFRSGDRDYQSVYLLEGKVELVDDNRHEVVASVVSGSEAARHPLAHKQPRQLSVRAAGSVTVARVDSSLLDVLLTWDESSGYDVVEIGTEDGGDWMTRMLQSQAFLQLPPSNIHQLLMRLEPVNAQAGELVIKQGDDGDYFYIVKSGRMAVSRKASARSKEVLLAELGEGACFGEEALVSGTLRNATVTMLTDGSLMRLSKDDFDELLRTPLVHELDYAQAAVLVQEGAEWLDVRLPGEFTNQHIQGSRNFPLSALREQADTLDSDTRYIICCDTGRRSAAGAFILSQRGFDIYTLRNGLMDVPGEVLDGVPDQPHVDTPAHDADIIPFENDTVAGDDESSSSQQDSDDPDPSGEQLRVSEAARSEQQAEAEALRQRIESLEITLRDSEARRDELSQQLDDARRVRDSAAETGEEFEKQRAQMELELARVREDYQQLGQRTSAVAGERDAASRERENARAELTDLKVRLDSRQDEVSEQVNALQEQLDARAHALEEEENRRSNIETSLAGLEQTVSDSAAREAELVAQIDKLGEQSSEQEKRLQDDFQAEKTVLEQQQQALQDSIEDYKQKLTASSGEHEALAGKLADVEQQLAQATLQAEEAGQSSAAAQQQLDEQAQEMDTLRQSLDQAKEEIDALNNQLGESAGREDQLTQRVAGFEQQLTSQEREYTSDLGSARNAMTRAQAELDNLKREQQRLLDRLRKIEEMRDRERHDHEDEVHRLHKEMKAAAGGSSEGLAAELQALQEQVSEAARLRDDLEIQLGERGAQMEDAQARAEQLDQQLKLAQQSAREAEQQLVETNRTANEEMEIRLNTEQGRQQGLREALEKSEKERNSHQETITIINQELEELRVAGQQSKQALASNEDAASHPGELQTRLDLLQAERDELRSSADALKNELDQLRAEAEVRRGLEEILIDEGSNSGEREALQQARQNVEMAVRLRAQAEERVESLSREVEQLRQQIGATPVVEMADGAIPSLDEDDPYAASPMLPDVPELDIPDVPEPAVLLDDDMTGRPPASGQPSKSGLMNGLLAGLLIGLAAGAGLFWWQTDRGLAGVPPARSGDRSEPSPVAEKDAGSKSAGVPAPANAPNDTQQRVADIQKRVKVTERSAKAPDVSASAHDTRPATLPAGAHSESGRESGVSEGVALTPVIDPVSELPAESPVEQPAGSFRDRLSDGGIGPTMMRLRADRFLMGSSRISPQFDERPQHDVRLGAVAIGVHEVTFNEYDAFARSTGRSLPADNGWGRATRPVISVSWEDARTYAQWLSAQTGARYRLATEAEWEFAARSGTATRYWWGEDMIKERANCFDCGSADGGVQTSRVGSFSAGPWGLYDMAGNVREWVQDCYVPNYSRAPDDGRAVDVGRCTDRVVRGGAYSSPATQLRSASRDRLDGKSRLDNLGFRVVREY